MSAAEEKGQGKVIGEIRRMVDRWRGFALGRAADPYPEDAPRYEPTQDGERPISGTTMCLLQHWFRHEPHTLGHGAQTFLFKYWPHQRRLVETFIYLHEVRGVRRTEDLYGLVGLEPLGPQRDPWAKLGGQLATGSGKTKMMSLLIAWSYLNAVCEQGSPLGFGRHSLLIAPGLFVRDRLFQDFFPPRGGTSVFFADPVVPPELEPFWQLKVYSPVTCPLKLDPSEGALVVTNYHQLLRERVEREDSSATWEQRSLEMLFEDPEPQRLEAIQTPLMDRFARSRGLLVLNDEAHHVWDETGHARFEEKAKDKARLGQGEREPSEMAWIRSIRRLHGGEGRVALQVDMSATLFEETGATKKPAKGGKPATEFKPADLFRHTVVHYGLAEAIRDGIVKKPVLERVEVKNKKTGQPEPLIRDGQPNAWERYRNLLVTGIERWKKVKEQLEAEGDRRKPILFVLCNDRTEAKEVANFLTHGEASREDLSHRPPTGWMDPATGKPLFLEKGLDGVVRSTLVEIHIGQREEQNEEEWERVRQAVNAVDHDEIPDPSGRLGGDGMPVMVPNPYNVVVSVMMLKEGWDVRNVKVIVPLRPCDSRTLTEQTLGRGLRKMHAPEIDDEGAVEFEDEALYVIEHPSFQAIIKQIEDLVEQKGSDEIVHSRDYIPILQKPSLSEREVHGVRLVRFEGLVEIVPEWRKGFDVNRLGALKPRIAWLEEIADSEIHTFLKQALAGSEEAGQTFTIPELPSYRDFDHILEMAFAIPLLRELKVGFQHKNAVKGVVQEFLERKTFALPMGVPLSFNGVIEAGHGRIALGNLARAEVIDGVKQTLLPALHEAITAERRASEAQMTERSGAEIGSYQALNKNVMAAPAKTTFDRAAVANGDELRVAILLDSAVDVTGWLYNHRSGVGYSIPYDWQGYTAHYFPDFIVRARVGEVAHNFIIEVKGRLDDRDKEKARRGRRYCEMLTEYDREPWHYLMLIENEPLGREDITWWQNQSVRKIEHLLRQHETLPLYPDEAGTPKPATELNVVPEVRREEEFVHAVPVLDLKAAAGGFGETQAPENLGWVRIQATRPLHRKMFAARVSGHSMEPAIPDGSWCLFRAYAAGEAPAATALDGHRVVVQLRDDADPETGGRYTLKRWRVKKLTTAGGAAEIELMPDNPSFKPRSMRPDDGDIRVVAEFLEVLE
jgi:type III restriction enzyme